MTCICVVVCTNMDHLCWCLKLTVVASNHVLPSLFRFHLANYCVTDEDNHLVQTRVILWMDGCKYPQYVYLCMCGLVPHA